MNVPRSELGLALLDGSIYAVGGWEGSHRLDSVERYGRMAKVQVMPAIGHRPSSSHLYGQCPSTKQSQIMAWHYWHGASDMSGNWVMVRR